MCHHKTWIRTKTANQSKCEFYANQNVISKFFRIDFLELEWEMTTFTPFSIVFKRNDGIIPLEQFRFVLISYKMLNSSYLIGSSKSIQQQPSKGFDCIDFDKKFYVKIIVAQFITRHLAHFEQTRLKSLSPTLNLPKHALRKIIFMTYQIKFPYNNRPFFAPNVPNDAL